MNIVYGPVDKDLNDKQERRDEHIRVRMGLVDILRSRGTIKQAEAAKLLRCTDMLVSHIVAESPSYFRSFRSNKHRSSIELVPALRRG